MSDRNATGGKPMTVDDIEVSRHFVAFTEGELRLYPIRKRRLSYVEKCIATASGNFEEGMPRGSDVGNPTLGRAVALMQDQERTWLSLWVRQVEDIYHMLDLEQQTIIKHLYFENKLKPEGAASQMKMHMATLYRLRNRALLGFAVGLVGDHVANNMRKIASGQGV